MGQQPPPPNAYLTVQGNAQQVSGLDLPLDHHVGLALPGQSHCLPRRQTVVRLVNDCNPSQVSLDLGGVGLDGAPIADQRRLDHALPLGLVDGLEHFGIMGRRDDDPHRADAARDGYHLFQAGDPHRTSLSCHGHRLCSRK